MRLQSLIAFIPSFWSVRSDVPVIYGESTQPYLKHDADMTDQGFSATTSADVDGAYIWDVNNVDIFEVQCIALQQAVTVVCLALVSTYKSDGEYYRIGLVHYVIEHWH